MPEVARQDGDRLLCRGVLKCGLRGGHCCHFAHHEASLPPVATDGLADRPGSVGLCDSVAKAARSEISAIILHRVYAATIGSGSCF